MGKNDVEEVSNQSTLVPVLVVIECAQGRACQCVHRVTFGCATAVVWCGHA